LFETSEEFGSSQGFGSFHGRVPQFTQGKVPQIGWNQVEQVQDCPLWNGIADHAFFYFLHGYYVEPKEHKVVVGKTDYGITYTSAIARGNIYAVQFHPEKSGKLGIQLLQNWVKIC
jgi:glutamine amidotransferase